jgi:hypothetical protein
LLVDRQAAGFRLPEKQGVGLARRIGCDIALALHSAGRLESRWIACTDADAELPSGYFGTLEAVVAPAVAVSHPFTHVAGGDPDTDRATSLYELRLRYYVLGLAYAGSPYAFHTMGSALSLRADAYAAVRGFPRRSAAEDFYVLGKVAKLGPIARPLTSPIRVTSRTSDRVPFGTGRAVGAIRERLGRSDALCLYHPVTFDFLRASMHWLLHFARTRDYACALDACQSPSVPRPVLAELFEALGVEEAALGASRQALTERQLSMRLHTWFDSFRTLKLVHAIRDRVRGELPWREAIAAAPFCSSGTHALHAEADEIRERLIAREAELDLLVGPTGAPPSS